MPSIRPGSISDVYGVLCKKLKFMIHYQEGYLFILDLQHVYITTDATGVTHVEPEIKFTNYPEYYTCHWSNRANIKCEFKYNELLEIIEREFGDAVKQDYMINNAKQTRMNAREILNDLRIYSLLDNCSGWQSGYERKLDAVFQILDIGFKVDQNILYVFEYKNKIYPIDIETIQIISTCIEGLRKKEGTP